LKPLYIFENIAINEQYFVLFFYIFRRITMTNEIRPFHLAFPVKNLKEAKKWYCNVLGCTVGRESINWIDFNLFGHQVVAHLSSNKNNFESNEVDGDNVPVRHFGVILKPRDWEQLKISLEQKNIQFLIKPNTRFKGLKGEQHTLFILDPSGNALEFKSFKNDSIIFEK
tara:strand:- start:60 stop:566 length:507 start_codon:yes stop_codon:yes gene_type:complete